MADAMPPASLDGSMPVSSEPISQLDGGRLDGSDGSEQALRTCADFASGIRCDDGRACNGTESCAPADPRANDKGCVAGQPVVCDPGSTCGEQTGRCSTCATASDADGDGADSRTCGGDDCDDADPRRSPRRADVCDGIDNDCNGTVDDAQSARCMAPLGGTSQCLAGVCAPRCNDATFVVDGQGKCVPRANCAGVTSCGAGTCVESITHVSCLCPTGFAGSGSDACVDVDECETNNGGCAQGCVNTEGGHTCSCGIGWTLAGDGKLCESAPPSGNPCDGLTACSPGLCVPDDATSYHCECASGYTFNNGACVASDECASGTAGCSHECIDTPDGFTCLCPTGMTLDKDHATCRPLAWYYTTTLSSNGADPHVSMNDIGQTAVSWTEVGSDGGTTVWSDNAYQDYSTLHYIWSGDARQVSSDLTKPARSSRSDVFVGATGIRTIVWVDGTEDSGSSVLTSENTQGAWSSTCCWAAPRELEGQKFGYTSSPEIFESGGGQRVLSWGRSYDLRAALYHPDTGWGVPSPIASSEGLPAGAALVRSTGAVLIAHTGTSEAGPTLLLNKYEHGQWSSPLEIEPGTVKPMQVAPVMVEDYVGVALALWTADGSIHSGHISVDGKVERIEVLPTGGEVVPGLRNDSLLHAAAAELDFTAIWAVQNDHGGRNLVVSSSPPEGPWLPPLLVNDGTRDVLQANVVAPHRGNGMIVWLEDNGVLHARSVSGTTLGETTVISGALGGVTLFDVAQDGAGRVTVVWSAADGVFARRFD